MAPDVGWPRKGWLLGCLSRLCRASIDFLGARVQFHIGSAQSVQDPKSPSQSVLNADGSIALRWVSPRLMNGSGKVFLLEIGSKRIPFDTDWSSESDQHGKFFLMVFDTFGGSQVDTTLAGLQPYVFSDAEEKRSAQVLAVEALLVCGQNFDGLRFPDGRWRVEFEGRQWRLSDFGYTNESGAEYV